MEFGVWFGEEMKGIMQSIATTGDDFAAVARAEGDPELLQAYQAGFHAALRAMAQALHVEPPEMRGVKASGVSRTCEAFGAPRPRPSVCNRR